MKIVTALMRKSKPLIPGYTAGIRAHYMVNA